MDVEDLWLAVMFMVGSIAVISAIYIDNWFWRHFCNSWLRKIATQSTSIPCLDPTVLIRWWSWKLFRMFMKFSCKVMGCVLVLDNLFCSSFTIGWFMVHGVVFGKTIICINLGLILIFFAKFRILRLRGLFSLIMLKRKSIKPNRIANLV